jgi:hypothetical protein
MASEHEALRFAACLWVPARFCAAFVQRPASSRTVIIGQRQSLKEEVLSRQKAGQADTHADTHAETSDREGLASTRRLC